MNKGYNKKIGDIYVLPLPYITKPLPPLILHNPVSVVMYLYALIFTKSPDQQIHKGCVVNSGSDDKPSGVNVSNSDSALALWQQGFFGKGTLSRSEPSWFGRTARRLGLDGGELSLEEITELRRQKRREFKREREIQQQRELHEKLKKEGKKIGSFEIKADEEQPKLPVREEDKAIVRGDTILRLEYLHLHPCEAVFLSLGLGTLAIENCKSDLDLLPAFFQNNERLWYEYIAYHYFRSLGWCARSGVKFGVDWLIYRRGPPFQHAEFAVIVMNSVDTPSWAWLHSNMRVVGGAKKTLVLLYVEGPKDLPDFTTITSIKQFRTELKKYTVKMFNFSRFAPSRNRD